MALEKLGSTRDFITAHPDARPPHLAPGLPIPGPKMHLWPVSGLALVAAMVKVRHYVLPTAE